MAVEDLQGVTTRAVEQAQARGADAAEAFATESRGGSFRIERNKFSRATTTRAFGLAVRLVKDGRLAFAYATDPAEAPRAIDAALDAARVLPDAEGFAFPGAAVVPRVDGLRDARVADLDPADAVDAAGTMLDAALDATPGLTVTDGAVAWGVTDVALANSAGFEGAHSGTEVSAFVAGVIRDGDKVGTGSEYAVSRAWDVDFARVGRTAADLARNGLDARPLPWDAGDVTVLFRPTAIDGLLDGLFRQAVLAETTSAGRSVYAERTGERVLPDAFSVRDDPTHPAGWRSAPFDDEGVPAHATPIVKDGVLSTFLDDVAGAAKREGASSGSAFRAGRLDADRSFKAPPKATGLNIVVDGPTTPVDDLVADVDRGVLVHDAMGAHTANPASGDFSVVSSTLFVIENGEIAHAGKPVLVSGNLPKSLENLAGLGDDARWVTGGFSPCGYFVPTMRLEGLRVTPG